MSERPKFVALVVSGGRILCRKKACFDALDVGPNPQRVLRYVAAHDCAGRKCAHCRVEINPVPYLKVTEPRVIG